MKAQRILFIVLLILIAGFIWLRNQAWMGQLDETVPVMAALPIYVWLASPWKWREAPGPVFWPGIAGGALLNLTGVAADSTFLLAASWCCWLHALLLRYSDGFSRRLLLLPLLGFPWLSQDGRALAWWFRITATEASGFFFQMVGMNVTRAGTMLTINGLPLSVEPECAGLNVLQSTLVVGFLILFTRRPTAIRFCTGIAMLPLLAWCSNTVRIISLGAAGVRFGADFATGWFHQWGGWMVLLLMFAAAQALFSWLAPFTKDEA
jgi:exosortase